MTVNSPTNKAGPFNGNDVATAFPFSFRILDESHIRVFLTDEDGVEQDDLELNTDYTVTFDSTEGEVTYPASGDPLPTGWKLTVLRDMPFTQEADIRNAGGFYPEVHEDVFDELTMAVQQVFEMADRAVKVPASDTDTDPDELIEELREGRDEAVSSAGAAATSATNAATSATAAAASATATAASATAAAASATSAAGSATTATTQATNAATSATASATSATNSASSATASADSASDAAISETAAAGSATASSNSATAAATSATNAGNSATAAATSATAAAGSATSAAASASAAASTLASALWRGVTRLTAASSPYTVLTSDNGKLLVCDTTAGAIIVNLPSIAGVTLPFTLGVQLDAGGNSVTVNRNGTDTIDGGTSVSINTSGSGYQLLADSTPAPDEWEAIQFGAAGGNITVDAFTGDGVRTTDTLSVDPGSENNTTVIIGGQIQLKQDYSVSGTTITYGAAPANGATIEVWSGTTLALGTAAALTSSAVDGSTLEVSGGAARVKDGGTTFVKLASSAIASQANAEAGTATDKLMTPERTVQAIAALVPARVLGRASTIVSAVASNAGTIPVDDTVPQNTEGAEYMSLAYTPRNAASVLVIEVQAFMSNSASTNLIGALFVDSTANALAVSALTQPTVTGLAHVYIKFIVSAGSTTARTYKFRGGGASGTTTFNGSGAARLFGGVINSFMTVTEYAS